MSANLQNKQKLTKCWPLSPLPRVLWTPSASSFTDSSRRSRFCTSNATTCPSTCTSGEQEKGRGTCHRMVPKTFPLLYPLLYGTSKVNSLHLWSAGCFPIPRSLLSPAVTRKQRNSRPHYPALKLKGAR